MTFSNNTVLQYLNFIGLDESETSFNQNIGKLAHSIYERIDEDKTFDQLFDEELAKLEPADKYDWVYLRRIKDEIRKSSVPFDLKPKRIFDEISQEVGYECPEDKKIKTQIRRDKNKISTGVQLCRNAEQSTE